MRIPIKQYVRLLARYLRPQWHRVLLLALLLSGGIGLQLYIPQIIRRFLDTATGGGKTDLLPWLAFLFIAVALGRQLLAVCSRYLGEVVSWTATNELRADLAAHTLRLDLAFHKRRTQGEMVERIDGDVSALANFFSQFAIDVLSNIVLMGGILILLYREDWRVGVGLTLFVVVTLFILSRVQAFAVPFWRADRQASAEFFGFLSEQLSGTEDIRSSGAVGHVMNRYFHRWRELTGIRWKSAMTGGLMWSTSIFVFTLGTATALGLGAWLWSLGAITIGTVYLIFHYTESLGRPIEQIRTQLQDLQQAGASIERVEELFRTQAQIQDGEAAAPIPDGSLAVQFNQVSFGYEADDLVLKRLSFELKPGQVMGLLGRTGSGKSTLARLLLRLYDPTAGDIRLGGISARETKVMELRRRVGFVTQDVQLFQASVRDNLTFFDPDIADERIVAVLEDLGLGAWYASLEDGLDTVLPPGGAGLSAGEAQLLAFARVFLRDPGLVILDEASSRLDPATEQLVEQAVTKLLTGRTGIIIAHRLATVHRADRIMILEAGEILEEGERTALEGNPGSRFSHLLKTGMEEVLA